MAEKTLPTRPALRDHLRQLTVDDGVVFRGGATSVTLRGRSVSDLLPDLVPLLDGTRTFDEICAQLPQATPEVLAGALQVLDEQRLLEDELGPLDGSSPRSWQDRYWDSLGAASAAGRLSSSVVLLLGLGGLGRTVAELLGRSGIGCLLLADDREVGGGDLGYGYAAADVGRNRAQAVAAAVDDLVDCETVAADLDAGPSADLLARADLVVLASEVPDRAHLSALNTAAHVARTPWLSCTLGADHGTIGPFVLPGSTACYECFRLRLASNQSFLDDALGVPVGVPPGARAGAAGPVAPWFFLHQVAVLATGEVVRHLAGVARPASVGAFLSMRPSSPTTTRHEVLKLPRCPVCGPVRFRPQMKIWELTRDEEPPPAAEPVPAATPHSDSGVSRS